MWRRRSIRSKPLLSVIVPMYGVEAWIGACLESVRRQKYPDLEIVVVDDGSPDESLAVAQHHAREDDRITIVRRPNGGLSAARNTGVEHATGQFLTFVDSDDVVTAAGLRAAMDSLRATGSDIAVLQYGRLRDGREVRGAPWIRELHSQYRPAVRLEACLDVMVNATAWGKVFRRDFYDRAELRFVEGVIYEDQAFTAAAYAAADKIDILPQVGYLWRVNESSLSQGQVTVENLQGRLRAAEDSIAALAGHPEAQAARALQQLRYNLANSALKLDRAPSDYLAAFVHGLPAIARWAEHEQVHALVPAEFRVVYALAACGDVDRLQRFVSAEGMQPILHATLDEDGEVYLKLPGWQVDPVPKDTYVPTAEQRAMRSSVRAVRRTSSGVEVDIRAWFPHSARPPVLTVTAGGRPVEHRPNGDDATFVSRAGTEHVFRDSGHTIMLSGRVRTVDIELSLVSGSLRGLRTHRVKVPRL